MNGKTASGRRGLRIFFIILLLISLLIFAGLLTGRICAHVSENELQDAVAVIGGADGPTAISVAGRDFRAPAAITGAVLLAASIIGLIRPRQK